MDWKEQLQQVREALLRSLPTQACEMAQKRRRVGDGTAHAVDGGDLAAKDASMDVGNNDELAYTLVRKAPAPGAQAKLDVATKAEPTTAEEAEAERARYEIQAEALSRARTCLGKVGPAAHASPVGVGQRG